MFEMSGEAGREAFARAEWRGARSAAATHGVRVTLPQRVRAFVRKVAVQCAQAACKVPAAQRRHGGRARALSCQLLSLTATATNQHIQGTIHTNL